MQCPQCGYENNSDDALSCNLCGKVFRKEVRKEEERNEIDNQPMSKAKKFYAWWKKGLEEDTKRDPGGTGIIGLCKTIGKIKGISQEMRKAKGEDLMDGIFTVCTLIMAIIIGVLLALKIGLKIGLKHVFDSQSPYIEHYDFLILGILIIFIWLGLLFIYFTLQKFLKKFS